MPNRDTSASRHGPTTADAGLAFALIYPSLYIFRMPGPAFAVAYVAMALLFLWALKRWLVPAVDPRLGRAGAWWVLAVGLVVITAAHVYVHPRIDVTGFRIGGISVGPSDGDNVFPAALELLFAGEYPYYGRTFLDQPYSPLPGALLLAIPFHLLGLASLQNIFWLGVFAWLLVRTRGDARDGAWLMAITLGLSPAILYQLMQGTDYIANGLYVLAGSIAVLHFARPGRPRGAPLAAAAFLGIALSSRLNFLLVAPLVVLGVYRRAELKAALLAAAGIAIAFLAVTLPFYLYDPAGFAPLHTLTRVPPLPGVPGSAVALPILAGGLALVLAFRRRDRTVRGVIRDAYLVELLLLVGALVLASFAEEAVRIRSTQYAMLALFFGVYAYGPPWLEEARGPAAAAASAKPVIPAAPRRT